MNLHQQLDAYHASCQQPPVNNSKPLTQIESECGLLEYFLDHLNLVFLSNRDYQVIYVKLNNTIRKS